MEKEQVTGKASGRAAELTSYIVPVSRSAPCSRLSTWKANLLLYTVSSHTPVLNVVSE